MTQPPTPIDLQMQNLRGAGFMVAAMALFAIEDSLLKTVSSQLPVGQILLIFGGGGTVLFALISKLRGEKILHPAMLTPRMGLRAVFEILGRLFFTLSLALTPLSSASAILQATPIVVAAAGSVIFAERVGKRRWGLILLGFIGVLMVLRPGSQGVSALSLLAVLGMLGFAGRDLATRAAPAVLSWAQLGTTGFIALIIAGVGFLGFEGTPLVTLSLREIALLSAAIIVGVAAYSALTMAMRMGELSVVTPFRYSRLLFGMGLGILYFGERPEVWELAGAAVIVTAGIGIMMSAKSRHVSPKPKS